MTTAPATPSRTRSLGKGVRAIIRTESASPAEQAAALIATIEDVQLPAALLHAAALILEAASQPEPLDEATRNCVAELAMRLAKAVDRES
ncbi:hypothetical protein [Streptomyces griseocarneus]|uniref:hypothetical protein n=1 Tax=Streptomyces griseocarneus TaxID=51201 RepID=UPI00167D3043|nr:hypothetical protein [Streptomyces griseocarneus]MBZ6476230.1 hypothetical protein [Streptomyces griseocarneus]GHG63213.1 hypothetical protein GCM10018779_32600 [Streptomyces griseocarneus]